ncbi:MAG: helix-hairpin-helix domain-containing protein [Candidatus Bathyarchaeia archaeon]|jgi:predicted flap endonuclease-1-like 5' DNA nuclease
MRLDYISYAVAIIFFIVTLAAAVYSFEQQQVWVVTTAVIGLVFIGLGYTQRPKATTVTQTQAVSSVPPPPLTQPTIAETATKEEAQTVVQSQPPTVQPQTTTDELMKVKGIKEKRAAQLKNVGINRLEDLTKASAEDLAAKLQISPKITEKWIANAREIKEKA